MKKDRDAKLITCILPKGKAIPLLEALQKKGVHRANVAFARGTDIHDPEVKRGLATEEEKDIVTVVAANEEEGEQLFDFIFVNADINRLGGGIIYMTKLPYATPYTLPELDRKEAGEGQKLDLDAPAIGM